MRGDDNGKEREWREERDTKLKPFTAEGIYSEISILRSEKDSFPFKYAILSFR